MRQGLGWQFCAYFILEAVAGNFTILHLFQAILLGDFEMLGYKIIEAANARKWLISALLLRHGVLVRRHGAAGDAGAVRRLPLGLQDLFPDPERGKTGAVMHDRRQA